MNENVGKKIKSIATILFIVDTIIAIILGIDIGEKESSFPVALCIIAIGVLIGWISYWLLYGYGELIDKTCDIERNTRGLNLIQPEDNSQEYTPDQKARLESVKTLYEDGTISEADYQQTVKVISTEYQNN